MSCSLIGSTTIVTPTASASGTQARERVGRERELGVAREVAGVAPDQHVDAAARRSGRARSSAARKASQRLGAAPGTLRNPRSPASRSPPKQFTSDTSSPSRDVSAAHAGPSPSSGHHVSTAVKPAAAAARGRSRYGSSRNSAERCADQITRQRSLERERRAEGRALVEVRRDDLDRGRQPVGVDAARHRQRRDGR